MKELSLPEEKIIPRKFNRNVKTYRMRRGRLQRNDCLVSLRFVGFRSRGEVCHNQDSTNPRDSDTMKRSETIGERGRATRRGVNLVLFLYIESVVYTDYL